eukprot:scaffold7062_cov79-Isochrysis_galbana.AAC.2
MARNTPTEKEKEVGSRSGGALGTDPCSQKEKGGSGSDPRMPLGCSTPIAAHGQKKRGLVGPMYASLLLHP